MAEIVAYLEDNPYYLSFLPVALQYHMYKMLTDTNDEGHYQRYKLLLLENINQLAGPELDSFYQVALNYSTRKINAGKSSYLREYLEMYRHALEREALFDDGELHPFLLKNTVTFALREGEFDWAEMYINQYQDRLPAQHRENAVNYNLATLYFYKKDYDQALNYLRDVEYENQTYNLNAKAMLLAIYYETDEIVALDSLFDAITAYLNRHKEIAEARRRSFRNLVSLTRKLTRIAPSDKAAL
ncbi:MAG: hypothetical protein HC821_03810, partial [Lewinella sp.]|nr:hypothetical protein [Lewinella sp.]